MLIHDIPRGIEADSFADSREHLVRQVTARLFGTAPLHDPRIEWSPEQAAALERGGLSLTPLDLDDPENALATSIAAYSSLLLESLDLGSAAQRLGVSESRLRQRLGARTLYGIKWEGRWLLPRFQFTEHGLLPGLEVVIPALDPEIAPPAVARWFTAPDPDLAVGAQSLSPQAWLAGGRDPGVVAAIAADLAEEW
ncbi:MAG TPA: DNA-binding protein [Chloroflexota bacterium]|nr:DNA-binding protein [Chloroflexota bacterium]